MLKKSVLTMTCFVFLSACGDYEQDGSSVTSIPEKEKTNQNVDGAIYLPGGAGLVFQQAPINKIVSEDDVSKIQAVIYELDGSILEVDQGINGVLESFGYLRVEGKSASDDLLVYYTKDKHRVMIKYNEVAREGFSKKAHVVISWRI